MNLGYVRIKYLLVVSTSLHANQLLLAQIILIYPGTSSVVHVMF